MNEPMITLDKTEATLSGWPPLIIIRQQKEKTPNLKLMIITIKLKQ